jgi:hypothetical protein
MAEVLARVRSEMQDRLKQIEAELAGVEELMAERARLERALATPPFAEEAGPRAARVPKPKAAKPRRARRGANRAAVRAAVETMPGASAAEVAGAAGVNRTQVYALLRAGVERGEFAAVELAGGQTGYRVAPPPAPVATAAPERAAAEPEAAVVAPAPEAVVEAPAATAAAPEAAAADAEAEPEGPDAPVEVEWRPLVGLVRTDA